MTPIEISSFIDAVASFAVVLVVLVLVVRAVWSMIPLRRPLLILVGIVVALGAVRGLTLAYENSPDSLSLGWLLASLPVYLAWRYFLARDARAARAQRLDQARGHERRRAAPPLPGPVRGGNGLPPGSP